MNIKSLLLENIDGNYILRFKNTMMNDNIRRTKVMAFYTILIDIILAVTDVIAAILKTDNRFKFDHYLLAYSIMIFVNICILIFSYKIGKISGKSFENIKILEYILLSYITFMLCWGSIISLMDQKLYGQPMVFMVNLIVCSVIYYVDTKKILIPFSISSVIIFIGLPFFQKSNDILVGHYVNLIIFVILAFICSRLLYYNFVQNFKSRMLLEEAQKELEKLSYSDELTGLPNRRSYHCYIEKLNNNIKKSMVSALMIDIDFFKQYNDKYGHVAGDKVLIAVADQIELVTKQTGGFAARVGGEEFIFLLENADEDIIYRIAEKIRSNVLNLKIPHYYSTYQFLTISIGVSITEVNQDNDPDKYIETADKALYEAKNSGRNCIKIYKNFVLIK